MKDRIKGGMVSLVLGDALGVPVEFKDRSYLKIHPVKEFLEFGTYNQPKGTWSDDSSLALCTMESLISGIDYERTMKLFLKWYNEAYWTATDTVFDIGITTSQALEAYSEGTESIHCGSFDAYSNGNGSLMRILPVAFETHTCSMADRMNIAFKFSGLTHAHSRSKIACWLYCEIIENILNNKSKIDSVNDAYKTVENWCEQNLLLSEWKTFYRCNSNIKEFKEHEIKSSGYVVDTIEASIYSFLKNDSIIDSILMSINFGDDTDSIAAVTGGLSGSFYGFSTLEDKWIKPIKRIDEIMNLIDKYFENKKFG